MKKQKLTQLPTPIFCRLTAEKNKKLTAQIYDKLEKENEKQNNVNAKTFAMCCYYALLLFYTEHSSGDCV